MQTLKSHCHIWRARSRIVLGFCTKITSLWANSISSVSQQSCCLSFSVRIEVVVVFIPPYHRTSCPGFSSSDKLHYWGELLKLSSSVLGELTACVCLSVCPSFTLPSGYSPTIKGQLLHVDTTSSMQYRTLLEAEMLAVSRRPTYI